MVLSTHVLPDVAACCDRVAILHRGELRHVGAAQAAGTSALCVGVSKALHSEDWRRLPMVDAAEPIDAMQWRVRLAPGTAVDTFAAAVVGAGFGLTALGGDRLPLEALRKVLNKGEAVVIDDVRASHTWRRVPYFDAQPTLSVLCMPLVRMGQVVGAL